MSGHLEFRIEIQCGSFLLLGVVGRGLGLELSRAGFQSQLYHGTVVQLALVALL